MNVRKWNYVTNKWSTEDKLSTTQLRKESDLGWEEVAKLRPSSPEKVGPYSYSLLDPLLFLTLHWILCWKVYGILWANAGMRTRFQRFNASLITETSPVLGVMICSANQKCSKRQRQQMIMNIEVWVPDAYLLWHHQDDQSAGKTSQCSWDIAGTTSNSPKTWTQWNLFLIFKMRLKEATGIEHMCKGMRKPFIL